MSTTVALTHAAPTSPADGTLQASAPPRSTLDKAWLGIYEPSLNQDESGYEPGVMLGSVDFHFNPKELTVSKSAKWPREAAKSAAKSAPPEFNGSDPAKLSLEMFFDATATHDASVIDSVEALLGCCVPTEASLSDELPHPPLVIFHWGSITGFAAFVTSVSAKYTLFAPNGTPIRASCTVAMEEMPTPLSRPNPTSAAVDVRGQYVVVAGDCLASVAYREYRDPALWRALADFNRIDDPIRLRQGTVLLLPKRERLVREAR